MRSEEIVDGWIRYTSLTEEERDRSDDFKYWDKLFLMSLENSKVAGDIFVKILEQDLSLAQVCELAAGPVEEFLASAENFNKLDLSPAELDVFRRLKPYIWTGRFRKNVRNFLDKI